MKIIYFIIFASCTILLICCTTFKSNYSKAPVTGWQKDPERFSVDTFLLGDINSDKIADTAFITGLKSVTESSFSDCRKNDCNITIFFSGKINPITFENAIHANIEVLGDIDEDGNSEIIIAPGWYTGCWGYIYFYSLKNNTLNYCSEVYNDICSGELSSIVTKISKNKISVLEYIWEKAVEEKIPKPKIIKIK